MSIIRVLFTGGSGFIGKNVLPILRRQFMVFAPSRDEIDLFDENEVRKYILENKIDVILHCANPNPDKNIIDQKDKMIKDSLRLFISIYNCRHLVQKIIYLGSGAVYDKSKDIVTVKEEECFSSIPNDDYGFAKYIMDYMTFGNVYNLCVFGCYGPGDADSKFITHCIRCCLRNEPITIRQDCFFDYLHVYDLGKIMSWIISNHPKHNMYNACSGIRVSLQDIAREVKRQMDSDSEIIVLREGLNKEYTGSNDRLREEYYEKFIPLEEGIGLQINWERSYAIGECKV